MAFTKKYPSGAVFEKAVDNFLSDCKLSNTFPSEPAMLLALDISDDTLRNYEKDDDHDLPCHADGRHGGTGEGCI